MRFGQISPKTEVEIRWGTEGIVLESDNLDASALGFRFESKSNGRSDNSRVENLEPAGSTNEQR